MLPVFEQEKACLRRDRHSDGRHFEVVHLKHIWTECQHRTDEHSENNDRVEYQNKD